MVTPSSENCGASIYAGDATQYYLSSVGYFVREKGDCDGRGGANMMYRALTALIDDDDVMHRVVRSDGVYSDLRTMHNNKTKYAACIFSGTMWYWSTVLLKSTTQAVQNDDDGEGDGEEEFLLEYVKHDAGAVEPSVLCGVSPREFVAAYTGVVANAMQEQDFVDSAVATGQSCLESKSRALMVYNTAYGAARVRDAEDVGRESEKHKHCVMLLARLFYDKIPSGGGANAVPLALRRKMFYECLWRCQSEMNPIAIANTTRANLVYYAVMYFVGPDMLATLTNEEMCAQSRMQARVQWLVSDNVTGSLAIRGRFSEEWRKNAARLMVDGGKSDYNRL